MSTSQIRSILFAPTRPRLDTVRRQMPGIALAALVAGCATAVHMASGIAALSPLFLAMVLGIAVRNVAGSITVAEPGLELSGRRVLRIAIVLLGFQLTLTEVMGLGVRGVILIVLTLSATFVFTVALGRLLGVDRKLAELIAAGTSVCGASAVLATNSVTRGSQEDVAYAIACVTIFGTISMLTLPLLGVFIGLGEADYGLWIGATVHEVAQVVAAAFQGGEIAGQGGTVAKLCRVIMLAPLILLLGAVARHRSEEGHGRAPTPWFVFCFVGLVLLNSVVTFPEIFKEPMSYLTAFLLTMALGAMGLQTDLGRLRSRGVRPMMLGVASSVFITVFGLTLILST